MPSAPLLSVLPIVVSSPQALDSVLNAECPVRTMGFFGPRGGGLYCCSTTESLSLWDPQGAQRLADFGDIRALARGDSKETEGATASGDTGWGVPVDYIVGCRYDEQTDNLWLVAGEFKGSACTAVVSASGITPRGLLDGGHEEQIRTFDWLGSNVVTGGEDGKLCSWAAPGSNGAESGEGAAASRMGEIPSGGVARRAGNRAGRAFQPYAVDGRKR